MANEPTSLGYAPEIERLCPQGRDWEKQPIDFFNASLAQRQLYVRAYNELQKSFPNIPLPLDIIRQRMQEIVNRRPRIWVVSRTSYNTRFRAVGEPTASDWVKARRPANEPWCEFTICHNDNGLSSFGGELWPSAWPDLFCVGPRTIYGQQTTLTPEGKEVVREAIEQYEAREADMERAANAHNDLVWALTRMVEHFPCGHDKSQPSCICCIATAALAIARGES